ncbi:MAG: hypothetical protein ACE5G1_01505 [bacterium]
MKKSISLMLLLTFALTLFAQDISWAQQRRRDKYSLAVLNLEAAGGDISRTDARLMSDRLVEELNATGVFYTMSQADMERGLFAKNLDPSGCASIECAVRAGQALGVQLVVIGTITQALSNYAIELQMVHVASKTVVKDYRDKVEGELNDLYGNMRFVARELIGLSRTSSETSGRTSRTEPPTQDRSPSPEPLPDNEPYYENGGGFKWIYLGVGLLIAGGVSAGVLLSQSSGNGGSNNTPPPPGAVDDLPGPPRFP